jgi:hypothetical protein
MKITDPMWKKSSYSQVDGHCVEVADSPKKSVDVRDSRNPDGIVLRFTPAQWDAFVGGVRNGKKFDR